ncbi:MAG TPA: EAL domain-containing protein [Methylocella sp.]|nr:EAL domain-containing protein [Methylocella sp.]
MSTIIIVDDQPINRAIYAKLASSIEADARAEAFANPLDALAAMLEETPDLIITDYNMPGLDGASFIRRVRAEPALSDIPIIVITVFEDKALRIKALEAGATDFLLSPVDHYEFSARGRNLLKLRRQQLLLANRAETLEAKLEESKQSLREAIRDSSARLAQVIDTVPAMISATDKKGRFLFMNAYQAGIMGVDPSNIVGRPAEEVLGAALGSENEAIDQLIFQTGRCAESFEFEFSQHNSPARVFLAKKSPLKGGANDIIGVVTSSIDITSRKEAERHLHHVAHHDSITDLPNRLFFGECLCQAIRQARCDNQRLALHLIDLDGFKSVNDVLGHSAGDELLGAISKRLLSIEQHGHHVARLGGDEFAVLQVGLRDYRDASELAGDICALLSEPVFLGNTPARVTASIGIAVYPDHGGTSEDLLRNADLAMYKAKGDGGDRCEFFSVNMHLRAQQSAILDAQLLRAVERMEFEIYYQPQVRLDSGQPVGVEALVRWRRSDGSLVSPAGFLPRAEQNGLILPISELVLRGACSQAAAWRRYGMPPLRLSVNLSPSQFRGHDLPLRVAQILNETELDPRLLDLEITENILMHDIAQVVVQLEQLSALGVSISIDDFGTGFSSLSYVKRLPAHRLKIDQSFVCDVMSDASDRAIIATIVNLAHNLGMDVVAEGIETIDQLECLRSMGCDIAQGYFCGKPMVAAHLETFLLKWMCSANAANA